MHVTRLEYRCYALRPYLPARYHNDMASLFCALDGECVGPVNIEYYYISLLFNSMQVVATR